MHDIMDLHTHTIVSGHAYNTMDEMINAAVEADLELLALTEHAPMMPGSTGPYYFSNLKILPRQRDNLLVLFGSEVNILDSKGHIDLEKSVAKELDLVIASMHIPCITPGSKKENTQGYLKAMEKSYINIIGHPDDARYPVNYKKLAKAAAETHTLLEINNTSLSPTSFRQGARENDITLLKYCEEFGTSVIINSDAHSKFHVGAHQFAHDLIAELDFPETLIVNTSVEKVKSYLNYQAW